MRSSSRVRRSTVALVAAVVAAAVVLTGSPAAVAAPKVGDGASPTSPHDATGPGLYVVMLAELPAAVYSGGTRGYPATRPVPGERFDRTRPAVEAYREHLLEQHDEVLDEVGGPEVLYQYTTAFNGFAARLDADQVKRLRATRGVLLVEKSSKHRLDTVDSPDFLGLGEAWTAVGGADRAGEGTVVGVVDSGIWPENPSFAGLPQSEEGTSPDLPGFHGACQEGAQWDAGDCNDKVVSARFFVEGFGRQSLAQSEHLSPRDSTGHGSHTASTAAGNDDVDVRVDGQGFGTAAGMAPGARIAAYKACWTAPNPEDDGCTTPDTLAAVDQAVADGVDVIGYAVSGARDTVVDAVELAFLNAAGAGVFVAASAGNLGPEADTVAHPAPWVTTVAAGTHRMRQGGLVLGDETYVGAMVSDEPVTDAEIVLAADVAAPGAGREEARICQVGSLDAQEVQDRIVVCERGTTARVDKSTAVARAGGAGMVLLNTAPDSVDADFHAVPTVHVDAAAADGIRERLRGAEQPTASLDPRAADETETPTVAEFSSRGSSPAAGGSVLKPDLTAPGVGVLAATAPPSSSGRLWELRSGTSASTAHVAGLAALLRAERPDWSPSAVKSAMMTTASDLAGRARPFAGGAGHVDPTAFLDPGLVFDASFEDHRAFVVGQGLRLGDRSVGRLPARNLNLPSIAVGALTGRTRVTRTVTNVSGRSETFSARITGLDGVSARVRPEVLELGPGESADFTVVLEADAGAARTGIFAEGQLTWTGLTHSVEMPVVVRPRPVAAPAEITTETESGSVRVEGRSGTSAVVPMTTTGLVGATPVGVSLEPGPFDPDSPGADADTERFPLTVPTGTEVVRVQLETHSTGDDVDLYVYRDDRLVAASARGTSAETVTLVEPEPGEYSLYVHSAAAANGSATTAQVYTWVVPTGDARNAETLPAEIESSSGDPFGYRLEWDELSPTSRWFGVVRYGETGERTLVTLE